MAFLIFAFMKQSLIKRIDQKQFHLSCITNEYDRTQEQISIMQQNQATLKGFSDQTFSSLSGSFNSIFQTRLDASKSTVASLNTDLQKIMADTTTYKTDTDRQTAIHNKEEEIKKEMEKQQEASNQMINQYQTAQSAIATAKNAVDSLYTAQDDMTLQFLNAKESRLNQEKAADESSLKILIAEKESYEKAEDQAAKDAAPKFGLG